jgi:hypothetical protein
LVSPSDTPDYYTWTVDETTDAETSSTFNFVPTQYEPGVHTITVTATNNCGTSEALEFTVTVYEIENVVINNEGTWEICYDNQTEYMFDATVTGVPDVGFNYNWYWYDSDEGSWTMSNGGQSLTFIPGDGDMYFVEAFYSDGWCAERSGTVTLDVNEVPLFSQDPEDPECIAPESVTLYGIDDDYIADFMAPTNINDPDAGFSKDVTWTWWVLVYDNDTETWLLNGLKLLKMIYIHLLETDLK